MLFREDGEDLIAISQPAHAWISGQLLRALPGDFCEPLLMAAEQHDIGWLDWEVSPSFDAAAGRPHLFRHVGARLHAPMWLNGVERALAAFGSHVALLASRHGGLIYRRYAPRHRLDDADAAAAQNYLDAQAPREAQWARDLALADADLDYQSGLIAFFDALSLALCGDLRPPLDLTLPVRGETARTLTLRARPDAPYAFTLSPWPFARERIAIAGEGRRLARRYADEAAFREDFAKTARVEFGASLSAS